MASHVLIDLITKHTKQKKKKKIKDREGLITNQPTKKKKEKKKRRFANKHRLPFFIESAFASSAYQQTNKQTKKANKNAHTIVRVEKKIQVRHYFHKFVFTSSPRILQASDKNLYINKQTKKEKHSIREKKKTKERNKKKSIDVIQPNKYSNRN